MARKLEIFRQIIDWESVERDYRGGIKSVRQIAKEHGISHTAVQKRAAHEMWTRELRDKIRSAAQAQLATEVASRTVSEVAATTERGIIQANAAQQVTVIREHRVDIRRARTLSQKLMADLEIAMEGRLLLEEIAAEVTADDRKRERYNFLMKAVGLGEHAGTLESVVRSLKHVIGLERQAFGIDDSAPGDPEDTYEARLKRLYDQNKHLAEPLLAE